MKNLFLIEEVVLLLITAISFYEFLGIVIAKVKKLTKNVSRLITRSILVFLSVILLIYSVYWNKYINSFDMNYWGKEIFINWQFLVICIAVGLLIIIEFLGIYNAIRKKLTKNIVRLVSHGILLFLFCILLYISVLKWNFYIKRLQEPVIDTKNLIER